MVSTINTVHPIGKLQNQSYAAAIQPGIIWYEDLDQILNYGFIWNYICKINEISKRRKWRRSLAFILDMTEEEKRGILDKNIYF